MKQKYILFVLMGLIGNSCSNQDLEEKETNVGEVQVTAGIAKSRVNFTETENITYANWENGDGITLSTPTQENLNYTAFVSESDATNATFTPEGKSLKDIDGETVYACYPAASITDGVVTLPATNVWTDTKPLPFAYAVSSIADSKVNLSFDYIHAFLKLTLSARALEKATSTDGEISVHRLLVKSASESLGVVSGNFNFEDNSSTITEGSTEVELTLTEAFQPSAETERSVYIPILPQTGNVSITIQLLHDYDGGQDVLMEMSKLTPTNGFASGHVYTLTLSGNSSCVIDGDSGEIHLAEAGLLSKFITTDNKNTIKSLKISGYLNGDDIKLLREMSTGNGILTDLDVADATIVEGGDYYYSFNSKKEYTENNIWGNNFFKETNIENVILPTNIVAIGEGAFYRCKLLNNITIPNGVTTIGKEAFSGCAKITNMDIPDGVTTIVGSAFRDCDALESISIGKGITTISQHAFRDCNALKTVAIAEEAPLTNIGTGSFYSCSSLAEIDIPDKVATIGTQAFLGCTSLTSVTIGKGVATISDQAFDDCEALTSLTIPEDGVLTTIGKQAFSGCKIAGSISFPETLTSIGDEAFFYNSGTFTINISNKLETIGNKAFAYSRLQSITISKDAPLTTIGENAFQNCKSLGEFVMPDAVTTVGKQAFGGCTSLASVTLSKNLKNLEDDTFRACEALVKVTIPEDAVLETIGESVFYECDLLQQITLPENLTSIGYLAFTMCKSLPKINIPDNVTSIGEGAFRNCSSLARVEMGTGVTSIGESAFNSCEALTQITIPEGVTSILNSTFSGCDALKSITIPDAVTSIGKNAFYKCN